jgi:hypothetical protein
MPMENKYSRHRDGGGIIGIPTARTPGNANNNLLIAKLSRCRVCYTLSESHLGQTQ